MIFNFMAIFTATITLITLWETHYWWVRIFDFPSLQIGLVMLGLLVYRIVLGVHSPFEFAVVALLTCAIAVDVYRILPYTPLVPKEAPMISGSVKGGIPLKVLALNVEQKNENYGRALARIREADSDVVLLLETDENWRNELRSLRDTYRFKIEVPRDNTYGMLFYSRLPIVDHEIRYLLDENVPSLFIELDYGSSSTLKLIGLHPRPPRPSEGHSTQRDGELALIAKHARSLGDVPIMVVGDLNDVAWSHTTRLFKRVSELLDPRIGRGFYNTFPAMYPTALFPFDHTFISERIGVVSLKVLKSVGSDHLPILLESKIFPEPVESSGTSTRNDDLEDNEDRIKKVETWEPPDETVKD